MASRITASAVVVTEGGNERGLEDEVASHVVSAGGGEGGCDGPARG